LKFADEGLLEFVRREGGQPHIYRRLTKQAVSDRCRAIKKSLLLYHRLASFFKKKEVLCSARTIAELHRKFN